MSRRGPNRPEGSLSSPHQPRDHPLSHPKNQSGKPFNPANPIAMSSRSLDRLTGRIVSSELDWVETHPERLEFRLHKHCRIFMTCVRHGSVEAFKPRWMNAEKTGQIRRADDSRTGSASTDLAIVLSSLFAAQVYVFFLFYQEGHDKVRKKSDLVGTPPLPIGNPLLHCIPEFIGL